MISVEITKTPTGLPTTKVKFTFVEATHEVVKLCEDNNLTDAFRVFNAEYVMEPEVYDAITGEDKEEKVENICVAKASALLSAIGGELYNHAAKEAAAANQGEMFPDAEPVPADEVEVL